MGIIIKIVENDTENIAKIVLIDEEDRVFFIKRSKYAKNHPGEWDLPGGHLKPGETLTAGLHREVKEETNLTIKNVLFYKKIKNLNFFWGKYNSLPIKLSHEHTEYGFFDRQKLDSNQKFQKIASEVLENLKSD